MPLTRRRRAFAGAGEAGGGGGRAGEERGARAGCGERRARLAGRGEERADCHGAKAEWRSGQDGLAQGVHHGPAILQLRRVRRHLIPTRRADAGVALDVAHGAALVAAAHLHHPSHQPHASAVAAVGHVRRLAAPLVHVHTVHALHSRVRRVLAQRGVQPGATRLVAVCGVHTLHGGARRRRWRRGAQRTRGRQGILPPGTRCSPYVRFCRALPFTTRASKMARDQGGGAEVREV